MNETKKERNKETIKMKMNKENKLIDCRLYQYHSLSTKRYIVHHPGFHVKGNSCQWDGFASFNSKV